MAVNGTNGVHPSRPLKAGIYAPIPTFFLPESEDLDVPSFEKHILKLAEAGVGPLLAGSMGEALHLSHDERLVLVKAARKVLDGAGFTEVPIIAGTGAGSTRETIQLCHEAAAAGVDYAIVITSGYYAGALANNKKALKDFFVEVSEKSPIPIMLYNYPGASGGIDLDSDLITEIATECPNTCGVKLTCGNVGKLTRVCATVSQPSFASAHPRKNSTAPFLVLGGFIDFLVPSTFANGHGAITGLANLAPYAIVKLFNLSLAAVTDPSQLPEAQRYQGVIARADYTIAKYSIAGTKFLLEKVYGYGGVPRKPLPPTDPKVAEALWSHADVEALIQLEREAGGKLAH
ncbi:dihydrodipicolinate synthetase [Stereum hirsutum FP-91666 SS1]|uniref:dihydrodipicolinate synthetase n=1 Tax=Stereum hirsutum (strain FP-91666) TaxID=721885 RepID=UPI000440D518|nr:dihydrodipicolinate synthetase [Stereum hirsutum FP-91666 SS1]EIM90320.1 dihydrodipicolinate synthetase [Stereum hirsutum FP-91666 SS1]